MKDLVWRQWPCTMDCYRTRPLSRTRHGQQTQSIYFRVQYRWVLQIGYSNCQLDANCISHKDATCGHAGIMHTRIHVPLQVCMHTCAHITYVDRQQVCMLPACGQQS